MEVSASFNTVVTSSESTVCPVFYIFIDLLRVSSIASGITGLYKLDGGGWSTPRPARFTPLPIVYEAGWATGPVWMGARKMASTGI